MEYIIARCFYCGGDSVKNKCVAPRGTKVLLSKYRRNSEKTLAECLNPKNCQGK